MTDRFLVRSPPDVAASDCGLLLYPAYDNPKSTKNLFGEMRGKKAKCLLLAASYPDWCEHPVCGQSVIAIGSSVIDDGSC